jgi:S1-C subfamily serine protease
MSISRIFRLAVLASALASLLPATSSADPGIYQQVLRSTVWIVNKNNHSLGSGAVVDLANQLVITNDHVVEGADEVIVYFAATDADGNLITSPKAYETNFMGLRASGIAGIGTVIARWPEKDLAVVQLENLPSGAQALKPAPASAAPGSNVHSIGNSTDSGGLWVYTPGKVRNVYPKKTPKRNAYMLVTTSPINPGDSGGPMVNDQCELVGVAASAPVVGQLQKNNQGETVYDDHVRLVSNSIDVREVRVMLQQYPGYQNATADLAAIGGQ